MILILRKCTLSTARLMHSIHRLTDRLRGVSKPNEEGNRLCKRRGDPIEANGAS